MIKNLIKKQFKSEFAKNVLTLFTGTTIAQMIPIILSPILTRLYAPEDFGLLALFISISSIITIISTLQYEAAIVLPKNEDDAVNILAFCIIILSMISISALIPAVFYPKKIATFLSNADLRYLLPLLPLTVFLAGLFNILNNWNNRKKQFRRIAYRTVSQAITTSFVKLTMGILGANISGLVVGTLTGQFTSTGVLTWLTWKEIRSKLKKVTKDGILKNLINYKSFPKYFMWQHFLNIANYSGVIFVISSFFDSKILGYYSFTLGILQRPITLIGGSISSVFYQKGNEIYNSNKNLWNTAYKLTLRLMVIGLLIFIPFLFFGKEIFTFVFGKEWYEAGKYAQYMAVWLFSRFIISPISSIPNIVNKQKGFLIIGSIYNIAFFGLFIFLSILGLKISQILLIVSVFSFIFSAYTYFWIRMISLRLKPRSDKK